MYVSDNDVGVCVSLSCQMKSIFYFFYKHNQYRHIDYIQLMSKQSMKEIEKNDKSERKLYKSLHLLSYYG